jgi:Skp family chaperone for outer membrane proteins
MNRVRKTVFAMVLSAGLLEAVVLAQTTTNPPVVIDSSRLGRVLQTPVSSAVDASPITSAVNRPERVEQQRLPQDIRDRLQQFERVREAYLTEQRELQRRLRGATDADRDQIRELIRERRAAWLEQFRTFRQEARERLTELRDALPSHREALDAARDSARQKAEEARERRGDQ